MAARGGIRMKWGLRGPVESWEDAPMRTDLENEQAKAVPLGSSRGGAQSPAYALGCCVLSWDRGSPGITGRLVFYDLGFRKWCHGAWYE